MEDKETPISFNVLLADDSQDDRFFFKKAIGDISIPIKLATVCSGEELMKCLDENSGLPDVLFLDMNMPGRNGNEFLIEIKAKTKPKDLPVVIYSTSLNEEVADLLYEKGAHYYIQKCNFVELTQTLHSFFNLLLKDTKRPERNRFVFSLKDIK